MKVATFTESLGEQHLGATWGQRQLYAKGLPILRGNVPQVSNVS